MAKNNKGSLNDKDIEKELAQLSIFDRAAKKIFSSMDNSYADKLNLNKKDQKFRDILNRELDISKGYSNGSIVDFIHTVHLEQSKFNNRNKDLGKSANQYVNDLFTKNINDVYSYYQNVNSNRLLEMADLEFISKFIPSLGKAVKQILNEIASSDTVCETINRKLELPSGISDEDRTAIMNEIYQFEKDEKLLSKLKNIVFNKTLITGTHHVYCKGYNAIFEEFDMVKKKREKNANKNRNNQFGNGVYSNKANHSKSNESYLLGDVDITPAMESVREILTGANNNSSSANKLDKNEINSRISNLYDSLPNISYIDSPVYSEALESASDILDNEFIMEALESKHKPSTDKKYRDLVTTDGTIGMDDDKKIRKTKFNIAGSYIKYINARNLIPIEVFNQCVGYLLIDPTNRRDKPSNNMNLNTIGNALFSSINIDDKKKHDTIQTIVNSISDGILNKFSKKFVTKNSKYKKMISDVIIANGLTNKDYNIQFIPESDIITFTVQEDENGVGESVIKDAIFMAKLLLTMVSTRVLNYINKTGNKTVAHVHRGPINAFDKSQIDRVVRDLQDGDITFNDLLSPNIVFNKFNRDGNMVMPTTRDGTKIVELELQEGQNLDMKPEFERELEKIMLLGTPVPSILMDYVESPEFAKQITSARIDLASVISGYQAELEIPTTKFYRKLCLNSNLTESQKAICAERLEFKLARPKVLANSNNSEFMSTIVSVAETLANVLLGEQTTNDTDKNPNGIRIKEILMRLITSSNATFIDWDELDDMVEKAKLSAEEEALHRSENSNGNNSNMDNNGF